MGIYMAAVLWLHDHSMDEWSLGRQNRTGEIGLLVGRWRARGSTVVLCLRKSLLASPCLSDRLVLVWNMALCVPMVSQTCIAACACLSEHVVAHGCSYNKLLTLPTGLTKGMLLLTLLTSLLSCALLPGHMGIPLENVRHTSCYTSFLQRIQAKAR